MIKIISKMSEKCTKTEGSEIVIIPVYNENGKTFQEILESILIYKLNEF